MLKINYKANNGTKKSNTSEETKNVQSVGGASYVVSNTKKQEILKKNNIKPKQIKKYILNISSL